MLTGTAPGRLQLLLLQAAAAARHWMLQAAAAARHWMLQAAAAARHWMLQAAAAARHWMQQAAAVSHLQHCGSAHHQLVLHNNPLLGAEAQL
jgi:hypothetical protein